MLLFAFSFNLCSVFHGVYIMHLLLYKTYDMLPVIHMTYIYVNEYIDECLLCKIGTLLIISDCNISCVVSVHCGICVYFHVVYCDRSPFYTRVILKRFR